MFKRFRERLTYANVTASLALFIALGGTSYALTLPRNSVGSAQIRANAVGASEIRTAAVRSREIRNRSIRTSDLSVSARRSLRGAKGDAGPQGPAGPAAARYFAAVSAAGQFVRGNATSGGHPTAGSGSYTVGFAQSISGCAFTATLGTTDATPLPPGRITVRDEGGSIGVQTFDGGGNPADLPFHVIVAC